MTPVFGLCDDYVTRSAALDPVAAGMQGLTGVFGAATDYSPDGFAAQAELNAATLAAKTKLTNATVKYDDLSSRLRAARIDLDAAQAAFKYKYSIITPPDPMADTTRSVSIQ